MTRRPIDRTVTRHIQRQVEIAKSRLAQARASAAEREAARDSFNAAERPRGVASAVAGLNGAPKSDHNVVPPVSESAAGLLHILDQGRRVAQRRAFDAEVVVSRTEAELSKVKLLEAQVEALTRRYLETRSRHQRLEEQRVLDQWTAATWRGDER